MSLLENAVKTLDRIRSEKLGVNTVYRRGDQTFQLNATPIKKSSSPVELVAGYGHSYRRRDFIITADDFPLDKPQVGDKITFKGDSYEVFEEEGETHSFMDAFKINMRIFTVES